MRAPAFWWRTGSSLQSLLLYPSSLIYGAVAGGRMRRPGLEAPRPVICIGNFTAGGAGKTPTAMAVAAILSSAGETPAFLSRGYGGRERGPILVSPALTARDVGDEPALLARFAPTVVSRDRPAGAALAAQTGASVIIMDDGLQNPSLIKDCAIAVVDGATGIGNGLTLPAGPLRAPMAAQWAAIDAVLVIGEGEAGARVARTAANFGKAVFSGRLVPDARDLTALADQPVLAFSGIGRPEKFFTTLREAGIVIGETRSFPDHHDFTAADIAALRHLAESRGLTPVTTEKDLVRLEGDWQGPAWKALSALGVSLVIENESAFRALLLARIAERPARATA
ncbi:tetraacyldisaccharide 4'-kinase [Microvirga antarctica]|uniref:tetraacyldisaccharide 4'-kinase n=1 Tax=Microvirga antarctica TaxID=2819233 RepID=UPI001B30CEEB|nr:tetraacyldisaccharide 4'-kinase [Microvirga antarctica]